MKKIKILFLDFSQDFKPEKDLLIKDLLLMIKDYEIINEFTNEVPELIIFSVFGKKAFNKKYLTCKKLFICGENIFNFNLNILFILKKTFEIFKINPKYINYFVKIKLGYINIISPFKRYEYYLRKLSKNNFAITTNNLLNKSHFSFPFFFHTYLQDKTCSKLLNKKKNRKKKFCAFIVSNPNSLDRNSFFLKLSKYKKVDSFGSVFNNTLKQKIPRQDYLENHQIYQEYKFVICFENSYSKDYITEKLINVMIGSSVGIYRGAPNVGDYFNIKSFLNWDDFGSDEKLIEKIIELDNDDEKYNEVFSEPYFKDNKVPKKLLNLNKDLKMFIKKLLK